MFSGFTSCESVLPDWSDTITGVASLGSSLQAEIFPFFAFVYTCAVPAFLCCTVAPRLQHVVIKRSFSQQAARHLVVAKSERKAAVSNFVVSLLPFSSQHFWHCSFQPSGFAASGPRSNADSWEVLTHLFLLSLSTSDLTHLLPLSTHRITLPATVCV